MASEAEQIIETVRAPLAEAGLLLEDVKVHAGGDTHTVSVVVDLDVETAQPVAMENIERGTRIVSELLDDLPLFGDRPFNLEVTSPGADRKLTLPRHFQRVVGRRIEVLTADQRYEGELSEVTEADGETPAIALVRVRAGHDMRPGKGPKVADPLILPLADVTSAAVVLSYK